MTDISGKIRKTKIRSARTFQESAPATTSKAHLLIQITATKHPSTVKRCTDSPSNIGHPSASLMYHLCCSLAGMLTARGRWGRGSCRCSTCPSCITTRGMHWWRSTTHITRWVTHGDSCSICGDYVDVVRDAITGGVIKHMHNTPATHRDQIFYKTFFNTNPDEI